MKTKTFRVLHLALTFNGSSNASPEGEAERAIEHLNYYAAELNPALAAHLHVLPSELLDVEILDSRPH